MLQQTQVKTVLGYWERWMRALPDIQSLASAAPGQLHKLWEGLGYYSRVRNMHRAAGVIVDQHGSVFPRDYEAVLALPGIGRYAAGAICSIAFNQPAPVLDGNVMRVLSRCFAVSGNPREQPANERLWDLAQQLVSAATTESMVDCGDNRCSHLNQALMELGALVCKPRNPDCARCPIRNRCKALRDGLIEELPQKARRPKTQTRRVLAFVCCRGNHFLVRQRPAGHVNGHLWEFPNIELPTGSVSQAAQQMFGADATNLSHLITIKHSITRYRITLDAWCLHLKKPASLVEKHGRWVTAADLNRLAFSAAHRKIADRLRAPRARSYSSLGQRPRSQS